MKQDKNIVLGLIALASIALLFVVAAQLQSVFADEHLWLPPEECADEDRTVTGNRSTPCRYELPTLESAEYRVRMAYPSCTEELVISAPGINPLLIAYNIRLFSSNPVTSASQHIYTYEDPEHGGFFPLRHVFNDGYIIVSGENWTVNSPVEGSRFGNFMGYPSLSGWMRFYPESGRYNYYDRRFNTTPSPDIFNWRDLVNTCLISIHQERQATATVAVLEAESTRIVMEDILAEQQATRQAAVDAEELRLSLENRIVVARTEARQTEALVGELARREVIAGILRDIVRIRLAGQEDRARITNEFLSRHDVAVGAFASETSEVEARIQEYLDFNDQLLASIDQYQEELEVRLSGVGEAATHPERGNRILGTRG